MITKLSPNKPVVRQTAAVDRTDPTTPLIIELHPKHMVFRLKGKHTGVSLTYDYALYVARHAAK